MRKIQILGTGCSKCNQLAELAERAAQEAGIDYTLEKIKDINEIMAFGVMLTPALAIDGVVKSSGTVPNFETLKSMISD